MKDLNDKGFLVYLKSAKIPYLWQGVEIQGIQFEIESIFFSKGVCVCMNLFIMGPFLLADLDIDSNSCAIEGR